MAEIDKSKFNDINKLGDQIDSSTFEQILEMDDDEEDRDFSKGIVIDFFQQARQTFKEMDKALKDKNVSKLSDLGHFIKGSSATIGLNRVRDGCEKIQHWGSLKDASGEEAIEKDEALSQIHNILPTIKDDCKDAEKILGDFFGVPVGEEEDEDDK